MTNTQTNIFGILLALVALNAWAAEGFTPAERKLVDQLHGQVEKVCLEGLATTIKRAAVQAQGPAAKWLNDVAASPDICTCTADTFSREVTPQMLRTGTAQDGAAFIKRIGAQCVLPKFKAGFSALCKEMTIGAVGEAVRTPQFEEGAVALCDCVQPDIDTLTVEDFEPYVARSKQDYADLMKTGTLPQHTDPSMLTSMARCGLKDLRSKLKARPAADERTRQE